MLPSENVHAQTHYRVCNYCEAMCGIKVIYDPSIDIEEKKIRVTPDKKDPFSKGGMCPKASSLGPLHFDENRLRKPVKKVGTDWQEISWSEAYDTIEHKLKAIRSQYGADAIASYLGNPIVHNLGMMLFVKTLTRAIGSKNIFSATSMDQLPHHFAAHFMFGHEMRIPLPDIDRTDYMIILGANPLASNGSLMTSAGVTRRLREIKQRGGKFIVIDPRKTETAKVASEHHFIKPGSDVYFLLALLHIIFRDNKVKLGRLADHVEGLEKLPTLVKHYYPARVATITGIDEADIERMASEYTSQEKAVLYGRMGLSTQPHGGLCHWLMNTINIVSGHFDTPGGMMFSSPAIEAVRVKMQTEAFGRWHSRVRQLKEFGGELPVSAMSDEFLTGGEGQVRAFMTVCGNPVLSSPNGKRLEQALPNLDFMFSIDNFINETTRHADLILPTPTGLEIDHYDLVFNVLAVGNNAKFSEALFPPGKDRPYDWQILKELARRLSRTGLSFIDRIITPRRLINLGLMLGPYGRLSSPKRWFSGLSLKKVIDSKHGIGLGPLRSRIPECLITPDRKIHLATDIFLKKLENLTVEEWPTLYSKDGARTDEEDFLLIGRRNVSTNNSWMHQVRKLSLSKQVRCTAMIHEEDADRLCVDDGELVKVISRVGEIVLPVEITNSMMRGVVSIPHGFGHTREGTRIPNAEAKPGVSVNDITDHQSIDRLTGNAAFSGQHLRIKKISLSTSQAIQSGKPVTVIFGSQSGNAEMIAWDIKKAAGEHNLLVNIVDMNEINVTTLSQSERILVISSTFGEGDMPDNATALWEEINQADGVDLSGSFYSVLALGDSSYDFFCEAGKKWDKRLAELGAFRLSALVECDVDYTDRADQWVDEILPQIGEKGDQSIISLDTSGTGQVKRVRYNRRNPMLAELIARRQLNKGNSSKQTMHYELSLADYEVEYEVGDALFIIPQNQSELVDELLQLLELDGSEYPLAQDRSLYELLIHDLELRLLSKELLAFIAAQGNDPLLDDLLQATPASRAALDQYLWGKDLLDLLKLHPLKTLDADTLVRILSPIVPRAYSISSSQRKHPGEVHITAATLRYTYNQRDHIGACSGYLADQLQLHDLVRCYFVPNKSFSIPADSDAGMIMVGPGTGIAPFRAFLEEREMRAHKGENWLFFGDRNSSNDFLYEEELKAMLAQGLLTRLDLAFSRDQAEKIYVQQRMLENSAALFDWLQRGAYFFVCGDAAHMATDVDKALLQIIEQQGNMDEQQAGVYIEQLKQSKRYVSDVY